MFGSKVTAPFGSDRTVMGGVGFFSHPNFGGRADLKWVETSFPFPFLLNTSMIWDKAGLAGTKLSRHLYGTKINFNRWEERTILFIIFSSFKPSDIICSCGQLEKLQPGVARGAFFLFGGFRGLGGNLHGIIHSCAIGTNSPANLIRHQEGESV